MIIFVSPPVISLFICFVFIVFSIINELSTPTLMMCKAFGSLLALYEIKKRIIRFLTSIHFLLNKEINEVVGKKQMK